MQRKTDGEFCGCGSLECLPRKQEARHWLIQAWWGMAGHQKFNVILSYPASIKPTQGWDPEWLKKTQAYIHTHPFAHSDSVQYKSRYKWHTKLYVYTCVCICVCICVDINLQIMCWVILIDTGRCYEVFQGTESSIGLPICGDYEPQSCSLWQALYWGIHQNVLLLGDGMKEKRIRPTWVYIFCSICILSCLCTALVIF